MSIPNCESVVARIAAAFPEEWRAAHTGGPDTEAFIRRLAYELHTTVDKRFGLNGKRGNPNDISDDALNFRGESTLGDVDPTNGNQPVTVIDVIGAAGTSDARPTWNHVGPATPNPFGAWVKPQPVGSATPVPVPTPAPVDLTPILNTLKSLDAKITTIGELVLALRPKLDQAAFEALNAASRASEIKTQIENLPKPGATSVFPAYEGRVFGTKVRLEPK